MAIYKCSECGHSISEFSKFCPSCGAADSGERSKTIAENAGTTFGVLAICVIVIGVVVYMFSGKQSGGSDSQYNRYALQNRPQATNVPVSEPEPSAGVDNVNPQQSNVSEGQPTAESFYVCCHSAYAESNDADAEVQNLRNKGYDAHKLWIPEYPSLSGAQKYLVYVGKHGSRSECVTQLQTLRQTLNAGMYGAFVSASGGADYIR